MQNARELALVAGHTTLPPVRTPEQEDLLINRVCKGETEIFYDLISPYQHLVYNAARSILRNRDDAEETAQEAYLKAYVHLRTFRNESKFSTWLLQIVVNEARSKRRKYRRFCHQSLDEKPPSTSDAHYLRELPDFRETPSEALLSAHFRRSLANAVRSLDHAYREVFLMRDVQHRSIAETAEVLQISAALVKTRLRRARLKLRSELAAGMGI
jgi:RNA polymerase sigma-70 factor (ECF subfamily)